MSSGPAVAKVRPWPPAAAWLSRVVGCHCWALSFQGTCAQMHPPAPNLAHSSSVLPEASRQRQTANDHNRLLSTRQVPALCLVLTVLSP